MAEWKPPLHLLAPSQRPGGRPGMLTKEMMMQDDAAGLPAPPMPPELQAKIAATDALFDEDGQSWDPDDDPTEEEIERAELLDRALAKYDTSSLQTKPGKKDNWIEGVGGELPSFVRAVAHALIRQGRPRSQAIQIAIGTIKRWAAGGGNVTAKTRAKAAKTVAEWEALKAKAAAK